jgi:hypothetical protein
MASVGVVDVDEIVVLVIAIIGYITGAASHAGDIVILVIGVFDVGTVGIDNLCFTVALIIVVQLGNACRIDLFGIAFVEVIVKVFGSALFVDGAGYQPPAVLVHVVVFAEASIRFDYLFDFTAWVIGVLYRVVIQMAVSF